MTDSSKDIIGKLDRLIDLAATDPKIERASRLRLIRSLLAIKLGFLGFLAEARAAGERKQTARKKGKREKTEEKEKAILKFIGEKGGRLGMGDFAVLGMSGRSLRRYLSGLRRRKLIEVEKRGREHFYKLI